MQTFTFKSDNRLLETRGFAKIYHVCEDIGKKGIFDDFIKLREFSLKPGMGFLPQLHRSVDIITIPLKGIIEQNNDLGNKIIAQNGEYCFLSTGSGVMHYEFNKSYDENLHCLEIEIKRKASEKNSPKNTILKLEERSNTLLQINNRYATGLEQYSIYKGTSEKGKAFTHQLQHYENTVILYVIKGDLLINESTHLKSKDTFASRYTEALTITCTKKSDFILIELPLQNLQQKTA